MSSIKFRLTELNCEACAKVCRMRISKIPGVVKVEINSRGREADGAIEADRDVAIAEIQQSLAGTTYRAHAV